MKPCLCEQCIKRLIEAEKAAECIARARDAALEEAAQCVDVSMFLEDVAKKIRALKTDPNWAAKVTEEALALLQCERKRRGLK